MKRQATRTRRLAPLALVLSTGAAAVAEPPPISPSSLLSPLEAGVADRGPSSLSLRRLNLEFRQDSAFEHVYAVPGRPDLFLRRQGAITAVFPESRYVGTAQGDRAVTPPGAVFHIGLPTLAELPAPAYAPIPRPTDPGLSQTPALSRSLSAPIDARIGRPVAPPVGAAKPPAADAEHGDFQGADLSNAFVRARRLRLIAGRSAAAAPSPPSAPTAAPVSGGNP